MIDEREISDIVNNHRGYAIGRLDSINKVCKLCLDPSLILANKQEIIKLHDNYYDFDDKLIELYRDKTTIEKLLGENKEFLKTYFYVHADDHDLRNVLSIFIGDLNLILSGRRKNDEEFLMRTKHIISVTESGLSYLKNQFIKSKFSIEDLVREASNFLKIKTNIECKGFTQSFGDENSIYRTYYNILRNAAIRNGENIKVTIQEEDEYIVTRISNENSIIGNIEKIFLFDSKNEHYGLSLSYAVITDNGGKILAYNLDKNTLKQNLNPTKDNNIAVFEVYLPKAK